MYFKEKIDNQDLRKLKQLKIRLHRNYFLKLNKTENKRSIFHCLKLLSSDSFETSIHISQANTKSVSEMELAI